MIELTQTEIIQLLRKRSGLNQGEFGARAFGTNFDSGRTKMKNIELGKQIPTEADLEKIARVLDVPVVSLKPGSSSFEKDSGSTDQGIVVNANVLKYFPEVGPYLELLNKAVSIDDLELIEHISGKLSTLFSIVNIPMAAGNR